ncbi:Cytochrome b5 domain-containing protein 1 [Echinococcus granulosus]|uniref:Cytochrome b5 domain-containing protein 1 n=1 Tax=Echinococcus granulosus TaxID=6210 RepID=U6IYT7_ECHGR|nr:Cytochrome b5 domain-containing protein [Echinococcus granulosus]EUB65110.1 Cytochrome b5 domain-containing protein [Echinococcus granulosus]KAH9285443.1 Cytochrome b5 domain-containing protein 1 [Echinococcus granulosus]CDS15319.1 cytochrome b5 domain containing protein 1 [Echinococcus granulosus]
MVKYYTPVEVSLHNTETDLWVSYLGNVYDLTSLCNLHKGDVLLKPILAVGGTDISHWFDPKTGNLRTHIDPITFVRVPYTPYGRFLHVPPPFPTSDWRNDFVIPWWQDKSYLTGRLTKKARTIRVLNTLTGNNSTFEVCSEETMLDILARYLPCNAHAASYTWKYGQEVLDMNKTLTENGIPDEEELLEELLLNVDDFIPEILLYYNDDLTEA